MIVKRQFRNLIQQELVVWRLRDGLDRQLGTLVESSAVMITLAGKDALQIQNVTV